LRFDLSHIINLSLTLITFWASGTFADVLKVNKYTAVTKSRDIYLIDLVSQEKLSPSLASALREVKITNGPRLGEKRVLSSQVLSRILRKKIKATGRATGIQLKIPSKVIIENLGNSISRARVKKELSQHWQPLCPTCKFEIGMLNLPVLPADREIKSWKIQMSGKLPPGSFTYPVYVQFESGREQQYWLKGQARVLQNVVVTTKAVQFGQRLRAEDLKIERRDVTYAFDRPVELKQAIGKQVRRTLPVGEMVLELALEEALLVKRGQTVKAVLVDEGWSLTIQGIAQENGRLGDLVSLRNPASDKILTGKITGEGEVSVK